MVTCANCGEENPGRARFCLECGSPLAGAAPAAAPVVPDEERKLDTLVFVDLVGSTALAESLDPEDVLGLLELYYGRLRAELDAAAAPSRSTSATRSSRTSAFPSLTRTIPSAPSGLRS